MPPKNPATDNPNEEPVAPTADEAKAAAEALVNFAGAAPVPDAVSAPETAPGPASAVTVTRDCKVNFNNLLIELKAGDKIDNHPALARFLHSTGAPVEPIE